MIASKHRPWWELVSPELVEQYVNLVRDTRQSQRLYRQTLNPHLRKLVPSLEEQVDRLTERLAAAIAEAKPAEASAELVEGGVA